MSWLTTKIVYRWSDHKIPTIRFGKVHQSFLASGSLRVFSSILIKLCSCVRNPVSFHDAL